jgi:hypothetical protein
VGSSDFAAPRSRSPTAGETLECVNNPENWQIQE